MTKTITVFTLAIIMLYACRKKEDACKSVNVKINPFLERYSNFECQNNNEYTYIFSSKSQIDSLSPTCSYRQIAFPIDETDMRYIIVGRISYHFKDTIQTIIMKDSCLKILTYEVNMVQRDTSLWQFPGVMSMFCSVTNIPPDYQVEVKYKYVPLE
jgi:hypothetical protein